MEQAKTLLESETSTLSLGVPMQILLSGLSEQACLARLGADTAVPGQLRWQSADGFVAAAAAASPKEDERLWVWLYRAPWEFLAHAGQSEVATTLAQWQAEQRAVLGLRRTLGQKLLLVNADRVAPALLCARLELPWQQGIAQPRPTSLTTAIASLFERMAPQYWDLYEMLEAAAWLPEGEPQFRHDLPTPSLDGLLPLLQTLQDGLALPALQADLLQGKDLQQQATDQLKQLEQELERNRQAATQAEGERQSLTEENDLLLAQLHQVQEELEQYYLDGKAQTAVLADTRQQLEQTTDKLKKLEQELDKAKQATAKLDDEHKSQVGKNQLLQTMLQQVQDDVKKQQEQKLADSTKQLQQASDKLQKLEQELEKNRQATAQAEGERQSLAEENDLLLAQLHQVQEELESYYLANRELQSVMGESQQTLHRARTVISRLVCNA